MFAHSLQADPSKADLSPHGPGLLNVCACFTDRSIKGGFAFILYWGWLEITYVVELIGAKDRGQTHRRDKKIFNFEA